MAWTHSACPSLKLRGQQLTKIGKKAIYKHLSLLFCGYKHEQLKGEVSSLKCSLFSLSLLAHATRSCTVQSTVQGDAIPLVETCFATFDIWSCLKWNARPLAVAGGVGLLWRGKQAGL